MKWPASQVAIIEDGIRQFIKASGYTTEEVREAYKGNPPLCVMYDVWRNVQYDLTCNDDHPAFAEFGRVRKVAYRADFIPYPEGCNDDHFKTVLKHVGKKLCLVD